MPHAKRWCGFGALVGAAGCWTVGVVMRLLSRQAPRTIDSAISVS